MKKRLLTPDEIECRVQQTDDKTYATFLLYKTARTDAAILTERYGNAWTNTFQTIDGKLYCTISVFDSSINQWISRMDVGTESNVEVEKGLASDAFKRAGFKWGIGDELYSAPNIKVQLTEGDCYNGKCRLKLRVSEIGYNEQNKINQLTLVDNFNRVRYAYPQQQQQAKQVPVSAPVTPQPVQQPQRANTGQNTQQQQPQQTQAVQYSPKAMIDNMMLNVEVIRQNPSTNLGQLQEFVKFYTKKLQSGEWKGEFDTLRVWNAWQSRSKTKQ